VAIEDVSFQVADGELVTIVGPSGCGKSTLLGCIAGLLRPAGGQVVLNGKPVSRVPDRLGLVFQDYRRSLYPWMSVRENVALPLQRIERSRAARRATALSALDSVGLAASAGKYPWELSGGMQQRVAIARALAYDPVLLLMDEPFGSLDAQTREDLEDLVLKVRAERGDHGPAGHPRHRRERLRGRPRACAYPRPGPGPRGSEGKPAGPSQPARDQGVTRVRPIAYGGQPSCARYPEPARGPALARGYGWPGRLACA